MLPDIERTIVALASGARPAPRAIVRLAGPQTGLILEKLCLFHDSSLHQATGLTWHITTCQVPSVTRNLPVTVLYWPGSRSYTGGPAAELHLLGSLPLVEAVIDRCCALGAQLAERGEFTLRAFLAGKLDLAQAEAVLGIIEADNEHSLATALSQLGGNLAPVIAPLRDQLINLVAELEAGLDFVEEDIQFISDEQVIGQLEHLQHELEQFAQRLDTRSSTDVVPKVVLAGLPNAGKSSLFNKLCNRPLAIVADMPGTTRDYLQQRINVGDLEFDLVDTAGWELVDDGSPRALAQDQLATGLKHAELGLLCVDLSQTIHVELDDLLAQLSSLPHSPKQWLVIGTKSDLLSDRSQSSIANQISVHDAASIKRLLNIIAVQLSNATDPSIHESYHAIAVVHETAVRCRAALAAALAGVAQALAMAQDVREFGSGEELVAAELRLVLNELATIIGEVHSDDILGEIFARFCIGK